MADVIIRPDVNVNALWNINAVANINEVILQPDVETATFIRAVSGNEFQIQEYDFGNPSGLEPTTPVASASLWLRGQERQEAGTPGQQPLVSIRVDGALENAQVVAFPVTLPSAPAGGGWVKKVFSGDWTFGQFDDTQLLMAVIGLGSVDSIDIYNVYLAIAVPPFSGTLMTRGKYAGELDLSKTEKYDGSLNTLPKYLGAFDSSKIEKYDGSFLTRGKYEGEFSARPD